MLVFEKHTTYARIVAPTGEAVAKPIEIRTHPITRRTCRVAFSRSEEREPAAEQLPPPPPSAEDRAGCPFCPDNLETRTPRLVADLNPGGRMTRGQSVLFPNLRSLNRNGYSFGLLCLEDGSACLELRAVILARSNHAAWTRSDHTGFEVMLGEMATFSPPEETAERARAFWC